MQAGYSGTPLIKKLGIKPGFTMLFVNDPGYYIDLLGDFPYGAELVDNDVMELVDFIQLFAHDSQELCKELPLLKKKLKKNGSLWVSWIKKSSKLETDISERDVRSMGLKLGLVDVKICAVDKDWSGLKFVFRKKDRQAPFKIATCEL